jgi:hypothetical protein
MRGVRGPGPGGDCDAVRGVHGAQLDDRVLPWQWLERVRAVREQLFT